MGRRKQKTRRWAQQQDKDPYVRRARQQGFRSRAAFKLEEIDQRDRLFNGCRSVLDLGASPGGWSQYAIRRMGAGGVIVAVDILPMQAIPGVEFIQGDFTDKSIQERIDQLGPESGYDLVICDISPNIMGIADVDQARSAELAVQTIRFSSAVLHSKGRLLIKVFSGGETERIRHIADEYFKRCEARKPKASKGRSREFYLLLRAPYVDEH